MSSSNEEDIVDASENQDTKNTEQNEKVPYREIVELYNQTCKSLPKVTKITDSRRRHIKSLWKELEDLDKFRQLFALAEESEFLSGRNGKWAGCNFDWLINVNNAIKVLEGSYSRASPKQQQEDPYSKFYIKTGKEGMT